MSSLSCPPSPTGHAPPDLAYPHVGDGLYLSTYLCIDPIARSNALALRPGQNISVWRRCGSRTALLKFWKLDEQLPISGRVGFSTVSEARSAIGKLLASSGIDFDSLIGIIGTPALATFKEPARTAVPSNISSHSIAHFYSTLLHKSDAIDNGETVALILDGLPDPVEERPRGETVMSIAGIVRYGQIGFEPVAVPSGLLSCLALKSGLSVTELIELADTCSCALPVPTSPPPVLRSLRDFGAAETWLAELLQHAAAALRTGHCQPLSDPRFSARQMRLAIAVKVLRTAIFDAAVAELRKLLVRHDLTPKDCNLCIGGDLAHSVSAVALQERLGFARMWTPPCVRDDSLSIGIALKFFHETARQIQIVPQPAGCGVRSDLPPVAPGPPTRKAADLANERLSNGPVIWLEGGAPIGSASLGHHSILFDVRHPGTRWRLNAQLDRPWWRAMTALIPEELATRWFRGAAHSPYAQHRLKPVPDRAEHLLNLLDADGMCRVETLSWREAPLLHTTLMARYEQTGNPVLGYAPLSFADGHRVADIETAKLLARRHGLSTIICDGRIVPVQASKPLFNQPMPLPDPRDIDPEAQGERGLTLRDIALQKLLPGFESPCATPEPIAELRARLESTMAVENLPLGLYWDRLNRQRDLSH